jgi:hypothetical protein
VVVDNLDVVSVGSDPAKANPPLVVHANAVLSKAILRQFFQTVGWRNSEIGKAGSGVEDDKLAKCNSVEVGRQLSNLLTVEEPLSVRIAKAPDHRT